MFIYNLLQIIAILLLFEYANATSIDNWKEKIIFCILVIVPIIPIIVYIGYGLYTLLKKQTKKK